MIEKLKDLIKNFNTTPFLFIGSGLTRRYYELPTWESLLRIFAERISNDEFIYNNYVNQAQDKTDYPKIAELIEKDFNDKWFRDIDFRNPNNNYSSFVKKNVSPFKTEIASYIDSNSIEIPQYKTEIEKFRKLTEKNISGIITTNYDCFLEKYTDNYKKYIGQEELVSSNIQGIAEIYKIHGCITNPETIVINRTDYDKFNDKSAYLAAKLMTIFLEYPIIFIGYSVSDKNIQKILKSILDCLSDENLNKLDNRFVFIEREKYDDNISIAPYYKEIGGKSIPTTKVTIKNYEILYDLLLEKKPGIPVKVLRFLKDELYNYTITHSPTSNLKIGFIDDEKIGDTDLALAIGTVSDISDIGLKGITSNDWYRNVILDDLPCKADDLLSVTYGAIISNANILPLNKYLSLAKNTYTVLEKEAKRKNFDYLISKTIKKNRHKIIKTERTVMAVWNDINLIDDLKKRTERIAHLTESEINVDDLEKVLVTIFEENPAILSLNGNLASNIRRLIRIYDYLKYSKK